MSKLLILEDEDDLRDLLQRLLTSLGFRCVAAENAIAAKVEYLKAKEKEPFDLALLDIAMQGMNGMQLAQYIRDTGDDLPILILSAYVDKFHLQELHYNRVSDMINKPFEPDELERKIRGLLATRRHSDRPIL